MQLSKEQALKQAEPLIQAAEKQFKGIKIIFYPFNGSIDRTDLERYVLAENTDKDLDKALRYICLKSTLRPYHHLLGITAQTKSGLLGLKSSNHHSLLIAVNLREASKGGALRLALLRAISHGLDMAERYERQTEKKSDQAIPLLSAHKALARSHASLKGDMFAALVQAFQGNERALEQLAELRGQSALAPKTKFLPEEYPYVMAMEALQFAYEDQMSRPANGQQMVIARQIVARVMKTFEISQIHQWWSFARPAQDMAWRGSKADQILSCAINTSDDPHVRALGMMMADLLHISPKRDISDLLEFNAFAGSEQNLKAHKKAIDGMFDDVLRKALNEDTARPLYDMANEQNLDLTRGRIVGWCANALQAAGQAYEKARAKGMEAMDIVRSEFSANQQDSLWSALTDFSETLVKKGRKKGIITLEDAEELAKTRPDFGFILDSILLTIQDPGYTAKLEIANEPSMQAMPTSLRQDFAPAGPDLSIENKQDMTAAPKVSAPSAPGLGGSSNTRRKKPDLKIIEKEELREEDSD